MTTENVNVRMPLEVSVNGTTYGEGEGARTLWTYEVRLFGSRVYISQDIDNRRAFDSAEIAMRAGKRAAHLWAKRQREEEI